MLTGNLAGKMSRDEGPHQTYPGRAAHWSWPQNEMCPVAEESWQAARATRARYSFLILYYSLLCDLVQFRKRELSGPEMEGRLVKR